MIKINPPLLLLVMLLFGMSLSAESLGDRLLQRLSDDWNLNREFSAQVDIASYSQPDTPPTVMSLKIFGVQQDHQNDSLALVLAPLRDEGRIFLNMGSRYWAYFPNIKRATILSALAVLVGDVSSGDLLSPPPLQLYDAKVSREEGNKVELRLTAKDREAPYGEIRQFYEGMLLKRALLFARSGVLLKEVSYSQHFQDPSSNYQLPGLLKIINKTQKGRYSVLRFSNFIDVDVNNNWFNPNNLAQVKG